MTISVSAILEKVNENFGVLKEGSNKNQILFPSVPEDSDGTPPGKGPRWRKKVTHRSTIAIFFIYIFISL